MGVSAIAAILLTTGVPWKKKQLKDSEKNKSYAITSENILNFTTYSFITFAVVLYLFIIKITGLFDVNIWVISVFCST